MNMQAHFDTGQVICVNCLSGNTELIDLRNGKVDNIGAVHGPFADLPFVGPGLTDLQVNGVNGIDFNSPSVFEQDIIHATDYLLGKGITTYLPTVITNTTENIINILTAFDRACRTHTLVSECIAGIHLEGPFISPVEGAVGAHDKRYVCAPDWKLFERFQQASGGRIKLITIAPEWEGSVAFIEKCVQSGVIVSIGHSMAAHEHIARAVKAGASLSTHLGNAVPLQLPRHPNILWDQLAEEKLNVCLIADGLHVPDSFIRVVMMAKKNRVILVSDATCFAGMPPGEYDSHIGKTVVVDESKRVSLKGSPGLLAGAAKLLTENVEYLVSKGLASLAEAWKAASQSPASLLAKNEVGYPDDLVLFRMKGSSVIVETVIKNGRVVFRSK